MPENEALAALLAGHRWDRTEAIPSFGCRCECGELVCTPDGGQSHDWHFRAHVADVLLASDWLREQRAEAWDEGLRVDKPRCDHLACRGRNQCVTGSPLSLPINPYRTTEDSDG